MADFYKMYFIIDNNNQYKIFEYNLKTIEYILTIPLQWSMATVAYGLKKNIRRKNRTAKTRQQKNGSSKLLHLYNCKINNALSYKYIVYICYKIL